MKIKKAHPLWYKILTNLIVPTLFSLVEHDVQILFL